MGEPSRCRRRGVGKSKVIGTKEMNDATGRSLAFLTATGAAAEEGRPFVAIVRSEDELRQWLAGSRPHLRWLQVEGLLGSAEAWAIAAQTGCQVPVDVIMNNPDADFSRLYQLVEVRAAHDVRVTISAMPGLPKAVRLAAALGLPIRILPGQPAPESVRDLEEAADFYLHDPMVIAPIEPFHSLLSKLRSKDAQSLWLILEYDPEMFRRFDASGHALLPFPVQKHLARLIAGGAECASCPWREICAGYFKWPDPAYPCLGVKRLFTRIQAAADEIGRDLAALSAPNHPAPTGGDLS